MKKTYILLTMTMIFSLSASLCKSQESVKSTKTELKTEKAKASYALGMQIGQNFKQQGLVENLDIEFILAGIKEQINEEAVLNIAETDLILNNFFTEMQKTQYSGKIAEGEKFLAENAKRKGVFTTPSGLQYEILVEGSGAKPSINSKVKTHYRGTLIDGTAFDSSYDNNGGNPASFPVNAVISGWTEALQLMPVGSKWKLYVPYNLAYGDRGAGQSIGPYETLIFEVELIDIEE
jgi:FKBP-type peptidyl-prolyl cis-trans isomerase FklB